MANGLDLMQHVIHIFAPSIAAPILAVGGAAYLAWFPLLGWDFFRLGRGGCTVAGATSRLA